MWGAGDRSRGCFKKNRLAYCHVQTTHTFTSRGCRASSDTKMNPRCGLMPNNFNGIFHTELPISFIPLTSFLRNDIHYHCLTCVITLLHCWSSLLRKLSQCVGGLITFLSSWIFPQLRKVLCRSLQPVLYDWDGIKKGLTTKDDFPFLSSLFILLCKHLESFSARFCSPFLLFSSLRALKQRTLCPG